MNPFRKNSIVVLVAAGLCSCATIGSALTPGGKTTVQLDSGGTAVVTLSGLKYKTQYTFAATDACCGASNTVAALDVRVDLVQTVSGGTTATLNDYPLAEGEMEDDQVFRTYVEAWPASFGCGSLTVKAARLLVSGDPFDQVTVSSKVGIETPLVPVGSPGNPARFSGTNTVAGSFLKTGSNFWFVCSFAAGQWYRLRCSQKVAFVLAEGVVADSAAGDRTLLFYSQRTGTFTNRLCQTPETVVSTQFIVGVESPSLSSSESGTLQPARLPAEHRPFAMMWDVDFDDGAGALTTNCFPVEALVVPEGRKYKDGIIDSGLLRFHRMTNRGQYAFTCQFDAHTNWEEKIVHSVSNVEIVTHAVPYEPFPVEIQVYDEAGTTCWHTNTVVADQQNMAFLFSPIKPGDYWVGFCQTNASLAKVGDQWVLKGVYSNVTCTVTVTRKLLPGGPSGANENGSEVTYAYDAVDGVYAAAIGNKGIAVKGGDLEIGEDGVCRVTASAQNRLEIRMPALAGAGPYRLVSGKWPAGLAFNAQTGLLTGIATVPGFYAVTFEAADGTRVALSLEVTEGVVESGSYSGVVSGRAMKPFQWGSAVASDDNPHLDYASVALSVLKSGKLTAKAVVGGKAYAFSASGLSYDAKEKQTYALFRKTVKTGGVSCEDELRIRLTDSAPFRGDVQLLRVHFAPGNGGGVVEGRYATDPECLVLAGGPDGSKPDAALVQQKAPPASVPSYYTLALLCPDEAQAKRGAGWLTMRLDAKGGVKIVGALPNGKSMSASGLADGQAFGSGTRCVFVPVCVSSGTGVLAGFVKLEPDAQTGKWAAGGVLRWNSVDPADVLAGASRLEVLRPMGGAYVAEANVQAVLQTEALAARIEADGIFEAGLQDGETAIPFPEAFQVDVTETGFSTRAKRLVMDTENGGLIDWLNSVNPFNLKVRLTQTTGVLSGTVDVWYWAAGAAKQKSKAAKLTGVLLQTQRTDDPARLTGVGTVSLPVSKNKPLPTGLLTLE